MADASDQTARLDALEAHIAHQDGEIRDLSDMVLKQWATIEALSAKVKRLERQIEDLADDVATGPIDEPPPPHY